ncbi:MAG: helix-turn-helix transcriptional regulator [Comamonas sp.]
MLDPITCYEILDAASKDGFADSILAQAHAFDGVQEIFGYRICDQQQVHPLISASYKMGVQERVQAYCEEFAALDPILPKISHHIHFIHTHLGDIAAQRYRQCCFDVPGFHEKISFSTVLGHGYLVISFYRAEPLKRQSLGDWQVFGQVTLAALLRYNQRCPNTTQQPPPSFWMHRALRLQPQLSSSTLQQLHERLSTSYPRLSGREHACVALSLLGLTVAELAEILEVGDATVVTFRKRACAKYAYDRLPFFMVGVLAQDRPLRLVR